MPGHQHIKPLIVGFLILWSSGLHGTPQEAVDLEEILRRVSAAIQKDWAASPDYAYVERDETEKKERITSKTHQVVMMAGSDYYMPIAIDDRALSPDQQRLELQKLRDEFKRRNAEDATARHRRIAKYRKERDENGRMLVDFPNAFNFTLSREESINGHLAYVLAATPRQRAGYLSRAAKVLGGMRGTMWVDKENYHPIRAEATVVAPIPIYGILARVLPGTRIEIEMAPVSKSTWLPSEFSMTLSITKFFWFKSTQVTRSSYSDYRPNAEVTGELLSRTDYSK